MKITTLIRDTSGQDVAAAAGPAPRRRRWLGVAAGLVLVTGLFSVLLRGWADTAQVVPRERLRVVTVTEGPFVRDAAAQGIVVAAVSPTLFATAPGTVQYQVQPGEVVTAGQLLAVLASPQLENERGREAATFGSIEAALARQAIEVRRQALLSRERALAADLRLRAAERELLRATAAWERGVIAERDLRRAEDERDGALLAREHASENANLERESLELELRARRLERDRQALVVAELQRRVAALELRSPIAGTVAELASAQGASVARDAPLLTVVDPSVFEIEFQVADQYARDIRPGMTASVALDGATHAGTVTAISPEVRQGLVTGRVRFTGPQPAGLRQSQRGSVRILLEERASARKFERGPDVEPQARSIYRVRGSRAELVPVELGSASVAELEVRGGLERGDQVIVAGTRDLLGTPEFRIAD
ncbi:MAG: HlyD family efflux transporter periplasmic adaptor subunit [Gammaproteobacteria bacterium]|nr:MAG: HlyD family efflux transporter periplasmic adaptor subunit [Gammaproteobacteria bacterium]